MSEISHFTEDYWQSLKQYTSARIALGRAGGSLSTAEQLRLFRAHARARDAVHAAMNHETLQQALAQYHLPVLALQTQAGSRQEFLLRPDRGRKLSPDSLKTLQTQRGAYDISLIIGDGLSARAIQAHVAGLFSALMPKLQQYQLAPICLVQQARVAISDEIGEALNSRLSVIFIGERPGLSAAESLGIYLTYAPRQGKTDETRNCISNVRPEGMPYAVAADKLSYLIQESFRRKLSGVKLKDDLPISLEG